MAMGAGLVAGPWKRLRPVASSSVAASARERGR
jgi:hypothetical protein